MEYQDYWKAFERSGSVSDYLHYAACARDELAAGIAEDGDIPEQTTMRAALATSAMSNVVPLSSDYALLSGTSAAMGQPSSIGLVLLSGLREEAKKQENGDPNP